MDRVSVLVTVSGFWIVVLSALTVVAEVRRPTLRDVLDVGSSGMPSSPLPAPSEVKQAFHEELHPGKQSALISWLAFTVTFVVVRIITHRIKGGEGRLRNVSLGGIHLHHYMWGILTISSVGGVAIRGSDRVRRHPVIALAYGVGLALIVDEFALLLDLQDVYWAKQGRDSVDLAIGLISSSGSVLVGLPVLRRLRRNRLV